MRGNFRGQSFPNHEGDHPVCAILGGGRGAHVFAALLAGRRPDIAVRVLTRTADQWNEGLRDSEEGIRCVDIQDETTICGKPVLVSNDPSVVLPQARYIVFIGFQNDHEKFLRQAAPYITPGCIIGALNCGCGFKCMCKHVLGSEIFSKVVFFATSTLPWACRTNTYGKEVTVFAKKEYVVSSVHPRSEEKRVMAFLNSVFCDHPVLNTDNFLALELMNPGSILHPTISRGIIRRHGDTLPWEHEPWFYRDLDDLTVREVTTLSNEYLVLKGVLFDRFGIDLSSVIPIRDWLTRSYPQDVVDKTNFKTMLTSNRPYRVAALPCVKQADGKYLPDYEHRYVREEIPCSSVVIKGIAVLAGVLTPQLDEIIGKQPYNRAPSPLPRYGP